MKKIILLCLLCMVSTTSQSTEKEYRTWGSVRTSGGIESIVPYPSMPIGVIRTESINSSSYGNYINFSIRIRIENVKRRAYPYIVIENKDGTYTAQKHGKYIKGTKGWNLYSTPSLFVSSQAKKVIVGIAIHGTGKVEYHDGVIE